MKLIRFGEPGHEKPGFIDQEGKRRDASSFTKDFNPAFLGENGIDSLRERAKNQADQLPIVDEQTRLGPPLANPGKIICVGLNYADHAAEADLNLPEEPIIFFKATSALVGPNDDLVIPKNSQKTDWEVELAVVIGKKANYVSEAEAMDYVAGYLLHNDYSERAFQLERSGQWVKGKSCDTFAPMGPFLASREEIQDVDNLRLWLKVNGELKQDGHTENMIFKVPKIISYISQFMSLHPGDIISTGTPAGVGMGLTPPRYLQPGDEVELGIEGLGSSKQKVKAYPIS